MATSATGKITLTPCTIWSIRFLLKSKSFTTCSQPKFTYQNNTLQQSAAVAAAASVALANPKPSAIQYFEERRRTTALIRPEHVISSGVSHVTIPDVTLDEYVWAGVGNWSTKIAVECALTGRNYTYGQCRVMTRRFASALVKSGFKPGDIIALVLPNIPEFPIVFLGANAAGLACTLINPQYTPAEIAKQMSDCDVKAVVTISLFAPLIKSVAGKLKDLKSIIVVGDAEEGCRTFSDMMRDDGSAVPQVGNQNPKEDLVVLPYSSGTTGNPKGVMLTHFNMVANIRTCIHPDWCRFRQTTKDYQEVFVVVLPFFHIYSLNAILMGGLSLGAKIVCLPAFEPSTFIKTLADYKPTFLHTVPRLMDYIATSPDIKSKHLDRVHTVVCGGSSAGKKIIEKILHRMLPKEIRYQEGYGMTESSPVLLMLKSNYTNLSEKLGSVGTPVPMTDAIIVDTETKESLGPYKVGELYCRGPQVMKGYWKNEAATQEAMDGDWLRTGDVAYYDDDGHFHIVDRIKELIKVKGFQVAPSEIEELLMQLPGIVDVGVIGIPNDGAGELPRAYITKTDPAITEQTIHEYLSTRLAPYKQLHGGIYFIDAIPRNPSGKILRKDLKAMALA